MDLDRCSWKMVKSSEFVLGQEADRCGDVAAVKILRPNRKTDLFLCEDHINAFIRHWGLHNDVELLCFNWMEGTKAPPKTVTCDKCSGEGSVRSFPDRIRCEICGGRGWWWE